jgi:RHS repeat-associated protein
MWQTSDARVDWVQGKHVYLNEDRIATKYNSEGNDNTGAEKERTYYYHSDHLGSAQVVTNWRGQIHERLEYTPYGELWIDWKGDSALEDSTPFRFTGKEMDAETGFYYYGARYLDPKTSRWISADPALGDYVPSAPVDEEAKKRNGNLPGQGGVFNYVNLHVYHYAGNNPVKYVDPDGREDVDLSNFISVLDTTEKVIEIGKDVFSIASDVKDGISNLDQNIMDEINSKARNISKNIEGVIKNVNEYPVENGIFMGLTVVAVIASVGSGFASELISFIDNLSFSIDIGKDSESEASLDFLCSISNIFLSLNFDSHNSMQVNIGGKTSISYRLRF